MYVASFVLKISWLGRKSIVKNKNSPPSFVLISSQSHYKWVPRWGGSIGARKKLKMFLSLWKTKNIYIFNLILYNFLVWTLQYVLKKIEHFFDPENMKKPISKDAHNRHRPFFSVLLIGPNPAQISLRNFSIMSLVTFFVQWPYIYRNTAWSDCSSMHKLSRFSQITFQIRTKTFTENLVGKQSYFVLILTTA